MPDNLIRKTLGGLGCLLFVVSASWCQNPAGRSQDKPLTQDNVRTAIQKGVDYLFSIQKPEGNWDLEPAFADRVGEPPWLTGPTAMALYALLECGVDIKDPRMAKGMEWLVKNQDNDIKTYSVGIRCNTWFAANKQTKNAYRKNLEKDVDLLVSTGIALGGGGNYVCLNKQDPSYAKTKELKIAPGTSGDNSNSQYLLLGAWAGYRSGIEIPKEFWETCMKFWIARQKTDGGWTYGEEASRGAMCAAGLASLFVCVDATMGDKFIKCNVSNEYAPVKKGLDWFDANFDKITNNPSQAYDNHPYYFYGVERIGLASGYKYFGKSDWYKEGCKKLIEKIDADGGFGHPSSSARRIAYTGQMLVFLVRGSRPVLFNRLEYDGDWNNRPRALANFCRWAENAYEHEVNWQIITLKSEVGEWHDAPIVLITGSKPPKFSEEDIIKLRTYVVQGGTLLSVTECAGGAFGSAMKNLYKKLFPKYELTALGKDHPLYTAHYKMPGAPLFHMVSNGVRPLALHTDADLPVSWQTYAVATAKGNFDAAANVLTYVTDRELYNRGAKIWPDTATADKKIMAARLRYSGNYDPEPLALERFSRLMAKSYKIQLDFVSASAASAPATQAAAAPASNIPVTGIAITQLSPDIKLAFLTGTGAFKLSEEEQNALKQWVEAGGLLIIDAAGGNKAFGDSAKDLASAMYGADAALPLPLSSPVYQLKDMTIDKVKYRKATKARTGGASEPRLLAVMAGDKPKIIISAEDLTAGLLGASSWALDGYSTESAFNIARNIVLYALAAPAQPAAKPN